MSKTLLVNFMELPNNKTFGIFKMLKFDGWSKDTTVSYSLLQDSYGNPEYHTIRTKFMNLPPMQKSNFCNPLRPHIVISDS